MPGIDLGQVSSNWKKLQATLSSQNTSNPKKEKKPNTIGRPKTTTNGVKRKRPHVQADENSPKPKKAKPTSLYKPSLKRQARMGATQSATSTNTAAAAATTPAKSLLEDHDLSPSDLTAAYGSSSSSAYAITATASSSSSSSSATIPLSLPSDAPNAGLHPTHKAGKFLALDCEMVGTGAPPATDSLLARVSVVNYHYEQLYDSYVQAPPGVRVTDYRTPVSGIRAAHLREGVARSYADVQADIAALVHGRVVVGHALRNDWAVLGFGHAKREVRDTSQWKPFRVNGGAPRLRDLARRELGVEIQGGQHSSLEDARAAMGLFRKVKAEWEEDVRQRFGPPRAMPAKGQGRGRSAGRQKEPVIDDVGGHDDEDQEDGEDDDDSWDLLDGEEDDVEVEDAVEVDGSTTQSKKKKKRKKKKRTKRK